MSHTYKSIGARVSSITTTAQPSSAIVLSETDHKFYLGAHVKALVRFGAHARVKCTNGPRDKHFIVPVLVFVYVELPPDVDLGEFIRILNTDLLISRYDLELDHLTPFPCERTSLIGQVINPQDGPQDTGDVSLTLAGHIPTDASEPPVFIYTSGKDTSLSRLCRGIIDRIQLVKGGM